MGDMLGGLIVTNLVQWCQTSSMSYQVGLSCGGHDGGLECD